MNFLLPTLRFLGNGLAFNWKEKRTGSLLLILLLLIALIALLFLHYKNKRKEKPCISKENESSSQAVVKTAEKMSLEKRKKIQLRGYIFFLISTPCCILFGSFCDHGTTCDILLPFIGTIMMGGFIPLIAGQIFLYKSKHIFYPVDAILFFIAGILCLTLIGIPIALVPWLAGIAAEILLLAYIVILKIYRISPESLQREKENRERLPAQAKALPVSYQITPLLNAVLSGDLKLVQATLAEHPEMLNIAYAPNGNTPLHVAALNGKAEIMQFLLTQKDIDKDRKNNGGKTAADIAAERGGTNFYQ